VELKRSLLDLAQLLSVPPRNELLVPQSGSKIALSIPAQARKRAIVHPLPILLFVLPKELLLLVSHSRERLK